MQWRDDTTLRSRGLRLRPIGKSKGYVFGHTDPVELGLVASLNRPGGNLTGVTNLNVEVGPKRLELLRELLPSATLIAVLVNPTNPTIDEPFVRELQAAARTIGLKLRTACEHGTRF
jgi:ABC-type uncharacterized transport system substrate-binding protein